MLERLLRLFETKRARAIRIARERAEARATKRGIKDHIQRLELEALERQRRINASSTNQ